jgi:hypothetical protein
MIPARDGDPFLGQVAKIPNQVRCHEQVNARMPMENVALVMLLPCYALIGRMVGIKPFRERWNAGVV